MILSPSNSWTWGSRLVLHRLIETAALIRPCRESLSTLLLWARRGELRHAQQQYLRAIANLVSRKSQLSEGGLNDLGYRPSHGNRIGNLCG